MKHEVKIDMAQQARNELTMRIKMLEQLKEDLKQAVEVKNTNQWIPLVRIYLYALFLFGILLSSGMIRDILFNQNSPIIHSSLQGLYSLTVVAIWLHIALLGLKDYVIFNKIRKLNVHLTGIDNIHNRLLDNLGTVDTLIQRYDEVITTKTTYGLFPQIDLDKSIRRFVETFETYENPSKKWIESLLKVTYFISTVLFLSVFTIVIRPFFNDTIWRLFIVDIVQLNLIYVIYLMLTLVFYIYMNVRFNKTNRPYDIRRFVLVLSVGFISFVFTLIFVTMPLLSNRNINQ